MPSSQKLPLEMYIMMSRIRAVEERLSDSIIAGEIMTPCHLYSGQEAIATGVCASLEKNDYIWGGHRSHGLYLAKGGNLQTLVAEIYTKMTGCSKGRGGSMHLIDIENGMLGSAPIVAGTIPLALGAALASHIRGDKRVTVSFFGDGATGEGGLYESLNFAALKKLPIIFVCENNLYSTHMPIADCRPTQKPISEIAAPFGMEKHTIDGNDVLAVFETAKNAVGACRRGEGPVFIECLTYRFRGHVGPDDNIQGTHTDIRPKEEVEAWHKKDPIQRLEKFLLEKGTLDKTKIKTIKGTIEDEITNAYMFSQSSQKPNTEDLSHYVFQQ